MTSFVTHLEAAIDGTNLPARTIQTLHLGRPLWVRYDLPAIGRALARHNLAVRPATLWRYRELLPVEDDASIVSLGEGMTPLLDCPRLAAHCGLSRLFIKDESQLPTGSFKSRGMAMAVSMARQFGIRRVAAPTAGNAGGAVGTADVDHGRQFLVVDVGQSVRGGGSGSQSLPGQRPDHGLRQDRGRWQGPYGLVRHVHAQGAVPN